MIPADWEPYHRGDDGSEQRVVLVEANTHELVVADADGALVIGKPRDISDRQVLSVPTDRLQRS